MKKCSQKRNLATIKTNLFCVWSCRSSSEPGPCPGWRSSGTSRPGGTSLCSRLPAEVICPDRPSRRGRYNFNLLYYIQSDFSFCMSPSDTVISDVLSLSFCCTDPEPGHPLHPEEHKEEPWSKRLALVEALHHRQTSDRGAAH